MAFPSFPRITSLLHTASLCRMKPLLQLPFLKSPIEGLKIEGQRCGPGEEDEQLTLRVFTVAILVFILNGSPKNLIKVEKASCKR